MNRVVTPESEFFNFKGAQESIPRDSIPPAYVAGRAGTTTLFLTRFLAPIDCIKIPAQATWAGGIDSLESIPGLLKSLKIRALYASAPLPPLLLFLSVSLSLYLYIFTWI